MTGLTENTGLTNILAIDDNYSVYYITGGTFGGAGTSGTDGTSGSSGSSGNNGTSGVDGATGTSGTDGITTITSGTTYTEFYYDDTIDTLFVPNISTNTNLTNLPIVKVGTGSISINGIFTGKTYDFSSSNWVNTGITFISGGTLKNGATYNFDINQYVSGSTTTADVFNGFYLNNTKIVEWEAKSLDGSTTYGLYSRVNGVFNFSSGKLYYRYTITSAGVGSNFSNIIYKEGFTTIDTTIDLKLDFRYRATASNCLSAIVGVTIQKIY